jgi:hypothetical protein
VKDGTTGKFQIFGFQSFSHRSIRPKKETLENPELYNDLAQGIVAFYEAFLVPEALKLHTILQY